MQWPRRRFGAILCDPPYRFETWDQQEAIPRERGTNVSAACHYRTMTMDEIKALDVSSVSARDCVLFLWVPWPLLKQGIELGEHWGFRYVTMAFDWMKLNGGGTPFVGMGYWTRANTEGCLLFKRGQPKRLGRDVPMAILEPRREHSRKPDCMHERIERLVGGPYLELFARSKRHGWTAWGDQVDRFRS